MKESILLSVILFLSSLFLIFGANSISISATEADLYFNGSGLIYCLSHFFTYFLGENDLALRLPFIIFHIFSLFLIYKIGKLFLKRKLDRVLSTAIYALLPGINSAAVLVNSVSVVIFLTLLFVYLYMYGFIKLSYLILFVSLFVDNSFSVLYLSLFFYAVSRKDKRLLVYSLVLFGISMYMYGFDDGGKPKGYFVDTLGVYAAIFSPFLFLYYIYALYRILIKEDKNLLWYISFIPFVLSLLLSIRQKVHIEDFAPFIVIGIPLMVRVFFNSYRVRLPVHRKLHRNFALFILFFLLLSSFFSFVNKPLYPMFKNYKKHFAYRYHVVKELAHELEKKGIKKIKINDKKLSLRLKFYGIIDENKNNNKVLFSSRRKGIGNLLHEIDIIYYGKKVGSFYIYGM